MVVIGDTDQIDNPYVDSRSNGLVYCANRMRGRGISVHVKLTKGSVRHWPNWWPICFEAFENVSKRAAI
tara:strand:- start:12 stop:218 length:207 start_codon:yes stop_codon:yes gene_type:complete